MSIIAAEQHHGRAMASLIRKESEMAGAVARHLRRAAREVRIGDCIFDVVAYDKQKVKFKLVECKLGHNAADLGHAFGQVVAYHAVIAGRGFDLVNAFSKKLPLSFKRLMKATQNVRRIRMAFYVALTDEACQRVDLIRSVKRLLPHVGVIRVKRDGRCRNYLREAGRKNWKLAKAKTAVIRILQHKSTV
jgi:hypothetical protein